MWDNERTETRQHTRKKEYRLYKEKQKVDVMINHVIYIYYV